MTERVGVSSPTRWDPDRMACRRAVEALRSGVPNADAVAALGSGQGDIEEEFIALLDMVESAGPGRPGRASLLVGGGFGEGKSHLLTHLGHLAVSSGFVVSTVTVSKETPLHDPTKVFRAAVESAVAPGGARDAVAEAVASLDPESPAYGDLMRWLRGAGGDLNERFAATLLLHQRLSSGAPGADEEFVDAVVRFWCGDPLPTPELRRALRAIGEAKTFTLAPVRARDLARQRLRFLPRLLRACGHAGWVVLFDEAELIGRYTLLQRGRSYAELARWFDGEPGESGDPIVAVIAMTDDFEEAVLTGKGDRELLPGRLRDKQTAEYAELAALAQVGMARIGSDLRALVAPDSDELDRTYRTLRRLHGTAFGWEPPEIAGLERLGATRMRQYVRAWINEWDLLRLDPAFEPATEVLAVTGGYQETEGLDG